MKVDIDETGVIVITPETPAEYFALMHLQPEDVCEKCNAMNLPLIIECGRFVPLVNKLEGK